MKRTVNFLICILSALLCICLMAGCNPSDDTPETTTAAEQTVPGSYQVEFVVLGETVSKQTLTADQLPEEVFVELEGIAMFGWEDQNGQIAEPFVTAVQENTVYTALVYPALKRHTPFLFMNEENCLRPDDALTAEELEKAMLALAEEGAQAYFPDMPQGNQLIMGATLKPVLESFFPAPLVEKAADPQDQSVTRAEFAAILLQLINFDAEELLSVSADAVYPTDVAADRADRAYLLEASVAHTWDTEGTTWAQQGQIDLSKPGFVNVDGWLYYVTEDNALLQDEMLGELKFDADGRYTCGDAQLDQIVAQALDTIVDLNPEGTRMDWLYAAYEYARDSFEYLGRNNHKEIGKTDWGVEEAKTMLTTRRGNCYNFAAAFWALARGLGYDVQVMSGVVLKDRQDHGWVFLHLDGQTYLCDPEWEYVYRYEREDFTKDMFMLEMSEIGWWNYDWTP